MKKYPARFHLPWLKSSFLPELTTWLGKKYALTQSPPCPRRLVFWDSFDWRLWQNNLVCFTENGLLHLTDLEPVMNFVVMVKLLDDQNRLSK